MDARTSPGPHDEAAQGNAARSCVQGVTVGRDRHSSRVEARFSEWIATEAGRYVESQVRHLALEDKRAGDRRGEINLYLALVRRASRELTKDAEGFVCNNSYRSLLARRLMARTPELGGFFVTRRLRGRR